VTPAAAVVPTKAPAAETLIRFISVPVQSLPRLLSVDPY
jgi:hypothetical protein